MKFDAKEWLEKIRSWLQPAKAKVARMLEEHGSELAERAKDLVAQLRARANAARAPGVTPLPGSMITFSMGRFGTLRIPRLTAADWENLYRKSFLYNSIAAFVCAYFAADLLVASLLPFVPPAEAPRPRLNIGGQRKDFRFYEAAIIPPGRPNLFSLKGLVPDNDEGGGDLNGPPVRSSLPLTLLGVIRLDDPAKSVASIEDKGQNQVVAVRVGEQISRDATVQIIEERRVIFLNTASGRREFIDLPQDMITATVRAAPVKPNANGIQQDSDNHYTLSRTAVDAAMGNFNEILTQARCVPELENGKPAGYRCFQIVPGSIYEQLGMQENDVICGIDGEPINDLAAAFNKLNGLKTAKSISICIKRNGRVTNKQYDIP
jgi:type II secretion system protein C